MGLYNTYVDEIELTLLTLEATYGSCAAMRI